MASTIDQQFVEFIVKSLVGDPDKVEIKRSVDEKGVLLELTVAQEDLGRVIGKRGATAQSIRTLLRALGTKNEARYNLKIIDPEGGPRPPRDDTSAASSNASASDMPVVDNADDAPAAVADEPVVDEPVADEPAEEEDNVSSPVNDSAKVAAEAAKTAPAEEPAPTEEVSTEADGDSMVARHRRDLEDFDDDEL